MTLRVGNAAGFLGDSLDAPRLLAESNSLDYLTLEYLAELTLSILARQRERDAKTGYARDFLDVTESLCPALQQQSQLKLITNAGGMNPASCARAVSAVLCEAGLSDLPVGIITGDDLITRIEELIAAGSPLENMETGQPLASLEKRVVSANAYLGAAPLVEALAQDARIVITGRVADASLTVAPVLYEFGWGWQDWDRLAAATVAGHLIECGAQVTGGYSTIWKGMDLANVGYPIAEIDRSGNTIITKPANTGGEVSRRTVAEQLVYEIGDPAHYLTPDVDVDFTTVEIQDQGDNRVLVSGATGNSAPADYKVSLAYHDGYTASGQLLIYGEDCLEKAQAAADMILARLKRAGYTFERIHTELLGTGDGVPAARKTAHTEQEVVLRLSVADSDRAAVERFTKEFAPLITSGPAGLAGYATGRPVVRPLFAYWPTLVAKELVTPAVDVRPASQWNI